MNKENWILNAAEQAEIFPPEVVAAPEIYFPTSPVLFSPEDFRRPQDLNSLSMVQQDLFALDPEYHDLRQQYLGKLPRNFSDYLAKLYKHRLKTYGAEYASEWFRSKMAETFPRAKMVLAQYCDALNLFKMPYQDLSFLSGITMPEDDWAMDEVKEHWDAVFASETEEQTAERLARKVGRYSVILQPIAERLEQSKRLFFRENLQPLYALRPEQLEKLADTIAFNMYQRQEDFATQNGHKAHDSDTAFTLLCSLYWELVEICDQFQIPAPFAKATRKGRITPEQLETGLLKLVSEKYWFNKLKRCAAQMREHMAIAVGMVNLNNGGYVSNERLKAFEEQRRANYEFIKNSILTNLLNEEEQTELLDVWLKSSANPKKRRIELMTRMNGFDQIAEHCGDEGLFITLTAPSKFHAMLYQGGVNLKWNGASPRETQAQLCGTWAKIRAELNRRNIKVYGFRVAEPHHDATPHWHLILYTRPEHIEPLQEVCLHYALEVDGNEPGAKERRCTFTKIDRKKGSGSAYLAKYISKGIDGYGMDDLLDDETGNEAKLSAIRVQAWASLWRIRQFQQIGGASVGVWRELRRLGDAKQEDEVVDILRVIADLGDWAAYIMHQGGPLALRKDLKARLHYAIYGEDEYKQPRKKVNGVENQHNGAIIKTRLKEWVIGRKPRDWEERMKAKLQQPTTERFETQNGELARPWTCVSNCTSSENAQFSEICRERIKIDLTARGQRFTPYDIDDILNGKRFKIYSNEECGIYIRLSRGQVIEEIIPKTPFH